MSTRYSTVCETCHWVGNYASQAKADSFYRQHSCARHIAAREARARGREAAAKVDRTPKPCRHKEARHVHGTHACYVLDRCRCLACMTANTDYERTRSKRTAYGTWRPFVPASPARAHVLALMNAGVGLKRIIALSGVASGVVWKLVYGKRRPDGTRTPSRRVRAETAAALFAVTPTPGSLAGGAQIDSTGTVRRLQALHALGYSQAELGRRLGIQPGNFGQLMRRARCTARVARGVAALYDEISMRLPPEDTPTQRVIAARARAHAATRGWSPPLAWDDDELDIPEPTITLTAEPVDLVDEVAIARACNGDRVRLTDAERVQAVRTLTADGLSDSQVADRLHIAERSVHRIRSKHRIPAAPQHAVAASKRIPAAKDPHDAGPLSSQGHLRDHGTQPPHAQPRSA